MTRFAISTRREQSVASRMGHAARGAKLRRETGDNFLQEIGICNKLTAMNGIENGRAETAAEAVGQYRPRIYAGFGAVFGKAKQRRRRLFFLSPR